MIEKDDCVLPHEDNSAEREVCSGATLNNKDRHDKVLANSEICFDYDLNAMKVPTVLSGWTQYRLQTG